MARRDSKACIPCRDRKRKCDKSTPSCSLCFRLGRICRYESLSLSGYNGSAPQSATVLRPRSHRITVPAFAISRVFNDGSFKDSSISTALSDQLSTLGSITDIRNVAEIYFKTIHLWFPILSETAYYENFPNTFQKPRPDFDVLTLSLALINTIPATKGSPEDMTPLYAQLKISIAMVEAVGINTLDVIRARLLMSLFEVGHGIPSALMSLASTARAAVLLGINTTACATTSRRAEELMVWWGIVMLDRHYSLERGDGGPCATQDLGSPHHLPRDSQLWSQEDVSSNDPLPLSTSSSIQVGPFARQAQVSHVVGLLLRHLKDQQSNQPYDIQEFDQLARTLLSFSQLFPEENHQPWPRYCGSMGMCYGGLMVLHSSRSSESIASPDTAELLQASFEGVIGIAARFSQNIEQIDLDAISPFPCHSVYLAALEQDRMWQDTGDLSCLEAVNLLISMLTYFGKRWLGARKLLEVLEVQRISVKKTHAANGFEQVFVPSNISQTVLS